MQSYRALSPTMNRKVLNMSKRKLLHGLGLYLINLILWVAFASIAAGTFGFKIAVGTIALLTICGVTGWSVIYFVDQSDD